MAGDSDVLNPRAITLPMVDTGTDGQTGSIGMSGTDLMVFNGTNWVTVTVS